MTYEAEPWLPMGCHLAEGPLWHARENRLYWTDIDGQRLWRCAGHETTPECLLEGHTVGGFVFTSSQGLRLFLDQGRVVDWHDGVLTPVLTLPDEPSRFNDLIATPGGGVIAGTMPQPSRRGQLYHFSATGDVRVLMTDLGCSNGLAFTLDRTQMYYIETTSQTIFTAAYDVSRDAVGEILVWRNTSDLPGYPDGMTIDAHGHLWVAFWDGGQLVRLSPEGDMVDSIVVPTPNVTSACFGGPDLRTLFITTAGGPSTPGAGDIYRCEIPVGGISESVIEA